MNPEHNSVVTDKAMLFHTVTSDGLGFADDEGLRKSLCITVHDIKKSPKGPVLGAGRLMTVADKQSLRDYLNGEEEIRTNWLPENLMMMNSSCMVWYVPSRMRSMFFTLKGKSIKLDVRWPSLTFCYDPKNKLRIAAYASCGRPKMNQPLYHAPLWNIYADTRLCIGNADSTEVIGVEAMSVWEEAVFNTNFTHSNNDRVLAPKGRLKKSPSYVTFIRQKARSGDPIKAKEMVSLNTTLEEWVEGRRYF